MYLSEEVLLLLNQAEDALLTDQWTEPSPRMARDLLRAALFLIKTENL